MGLYTVKASQGDPYLKAFTAVLGLVAAEDTPFRHIPTDLFTQEYAWLWGVRRDAYPGGTGKMPISQDFT